MKDWLNQGCQTHSVLRATFTYLNFIWARLEKEFQQARLYINGSQTYLSAGTGNQLMKFRGTPATQIYSYGWRLALFGNHHFSRQRPPKIV